LAATQAGLQVVPVNWHLAEAEIAFILRDSEARAVIAHANLGPRLLGAIQRFGTRAELMIVIGHADGFVSLTEFLMPFRPDTVEVPTRGRMMAYTSATTGRPKAVVLPGSNASNALARR